ncbi:unnamed protein product, partial [Scytosiphon promiscuus]
MTTDGEHGSGSRHAALVGLALPSTNGGGGVDGDEKDSLTVSSLSPASSLSSLGEEEGGVEDGGRGGAARAAGDAARGRERRTFWEHQRLAKREQGEVRNDEAVGRQVRQQATAAAAAAAAAVLTGEAVARIGCR